MAIQTECAWCHKVLVVGEKMLIAGIECISHGCCDDCKKVAFALDYGGIEQRMEELCKTK